MSDAPGMIALKILVYLENNTYACFIPSHFQSNQHFFITQDYHDPSQQPKNLVKLAWCVPASCTPQDLEDSLNRYLEEADTDLSGENVTYSANVPAIACQTGEERQIMDKVDVGFW